MAEFAASVGSHRRCVWAAPVGSLTLVHGAHRTGRSGLGRGSLADGLRRCPFQGDDHFPHEGAIAMADLSLQRSRRPEIRSLAEPIRTSQSPRDRPDAPLVRAVVWHQWARLEGCRPAMEPWAGTGAGMGMGWGRPGFGTSLEALRSPPDVDRYVHELRIGHHRMGVMTRPMPSGATCIQSGVNWKLRCCGCRARRSIKRSVGTACGRRLVQPRRLLPRSDDGAGAFGGERSAGATGGAHLRRPGA